MVGRPGLLAYSSTKPPGSQSQVASKREQLAGGRKEVAIPAIHADFSSAVQDKLSPGV